MKLFGGTSNPVLTQEVCNYLGIEPGKMTAKTFSDGETLIEIHENIRGGDVFVLQSTSTPVNDALRRASAERITAIIPYYGYGRQDRKVKPRVPITAKLVADLITVSGASRVVSMDLHAGQIQGYFNIPVDNIFAAPLLLKHILSHFEDNLVIVSPDAGGVERARAFAKRLEASLAIIDKRRDVPNVAEAMNIIGEVEGKTAVILDDMVDTGGTLTQAAAALKDRGTSQIYACCTHPVLSGPSIEKIEASPIDQMVVTNTIPLNENAQKCSKIIVLSVAELLGETIKRVFNSHSVSTLFV
jgi:ribose-phosphate pyrophosphokinase